MRAAKSSGPLYFKMRVHMNLVDSYAASLLPEESAPYLNHARAFDGWGCDIDRRVARTVAAGSVGRHGVGGRDQRGH
jgi:hypothetical protein